MHIQNPILIIQMILIFILVSNTDQKEHIHIIIQTREENQIQTNQDLFTIQMMTFLGHILKRNLMRIKNLIRKKIKALKIITIIIIIIIIIQMQITKLIFLKKTLKRPRISLKPIIQELMRKLSESVCMKI